MGGSGLTPEVWWLQRTNQVFDDYWRDLYTRIPQTQAGHVLVTAARVSELLREALLTKMRTLTKNEQKQLFEDEGPLSTFASRIALAFALDLITAQMRSDLKASKDIRNKFAHTQGPLDFSDPVIVKLCKRLSTYVPDSNELMHWGYMQALMKISHHLCAMLAPLQLRGDLEKQQGS